MTNEYVREQIEETVVQEHMGITLRMGIVTCRCGTERALVKSYKCLYCGEWMCHPCAEVHFGKTVQQYNEEKSNDNDTEES